LHQDFNLQHQILQCRAQEFARRPRGSSEGFAAELNREAITLKRASSTFPGSSRDVSDVRLIGIDFRRAIRASAAFANLPYCNKIKQLQQSAAVVASQLEGDSLRNSSICDDGFRVEVMFHDRGELPPFSATPLELLQLVPAPPISSCPPSRKLQSVR
jgi:hypothetical protein